MILLNKTSIGAAVSLFCFALLFGPFFGAPVSWAEESNQPASEQQIEIKQIEIIGAQRIGAQTVRNRTGLQPGDLINNSEIENTVLKKLFATGLFMDVQVILSDGVLQILVVENPVVNRVAFEGNDQVKNEILLSEVSLKPRAVYTRSAALRDVERIRQIYRRQGRYNAVINAQTITRDDNRLDIVFEIDEGESSAIRKIVFLGNTAFSDSDLRSKIFSREEAWWRFGSIDSYDPARQDADEGALEAFYQNNGYADVQIVSSIAEVNLANGQFYLTFTIDEGQKYNFGEIVIDSKIEGLEMEEALDSLLAQSGETFSLSALQDSLVQIVDLAGAKQFFFVDVRPNLQARTGEDGLQYQDVTFEIAAGRRAYIETINVSGNHRTLDRVIRRELKFVEGDPYNAVLIQKSRQNLLDTGYFKSVDINVQNGSQPDQLVVEVKVQDTSTGELSFGIGYSTTDNVLLSLGIKERNYLGSGRIVGLSGKVSSKQKAINFSMTEPKFDDRPLLVGGDLFYKQANQVKTYSVNSAGLSAKARYELYPRLTQGWRYQLSVEKIYDVASSITYVAEGTRSRSALSQTLTWHNLDSTLRPTRGLSTQWSIEYAGLGGDIHLLKNTGNIKYYIPFAPEWVMQISTGVGYARSLKDDEVGINDRFFLGGQNLRGFRYGGAGPRDKETGNSLGGNFRHTMNVEQNFPLGTAKDVGIRGFAFLDSGILYGLDANSANIQQSKSYRASAGVGIKWTSPIGPLNLSWGRVLKKDSYDIDEVFRLSVGTSF